MKTKEIYASSTAQCVDVSKPSPSVHRLINLKIQEDRARNYIINENKRNLCEFCRPVRRFFKNIPVGASTHKFENSRGPGAKLHHQ